MTPKVCHVNFAQDPLHEYIDECQKKKFVSFIYTLFLHYNRSFEVNLVLKISDEERLLKDIIGYRVKQPSP